MELVEHSFSFHASEIQMNNTRKVNILVPSLEKARLYFHKCQFLFLGKNIAALVSANKFRPNISQMFDYCAVWFMTIPSTESEFGILCKNMQWKSTRNIFQFVSSQQKQAQALLLKPLLSTVPYIPTGLSMYSSQELLHHLYSSHISSSIQDEQTFAITWINVSQWRVFQTNLVVRKQNVQLHKCAKSLRCYRET